MQQNTKEMERMKRKAAYDAHVLTEKTENVSQPGVLSPVRENNISLPNQVTDEDKTFHVTLHNVKNEFPPITVGVKNLALLGCEGGPDKELARLQEGFRRQVTWMHYSLDMDLYLLWYNNSLVEEVETSAFARDYLKFILEEAERSVYGNFPAAGPSPALNLRTLRDDITSFVNDSFPPYTEWGRWALVGLEMLIRQSDLGITDYFKPVYALLSQMPPPVSSLVRMRFDIIKTFIVTAIISLEDTMMVGGIPFLRSDATYPLGTYPHPKTWTDASFAGDIHWYPSVGYFESTFTGNASENNWHYPTRPGESNTHWIWKGEYAGTCSLPKPWGDMTYIGAIHFYRQTFNPTFSGYYKSRFNGVATEENKYYFPTRPEESNAYWTWIGRSCSIEEA